MLSKTSLARTYRRIAVTLALVLPFLVFFDAPRNIDMQGYLVVVVGVAAWLAIALQAGRCRLERPTNILLAIFGLSLLLSTFFRPHLGYNLLGAPFARLGLLQLLSCIGFGIMAAGFKREIAIPITSRPSTEEPMIIRRRFFFFRARSGRATSMDEVTGVKPGARAGWAPAITSKLL